METKAANSFCKNVLKQRHPIQRYELHFLNNLLLLSVIFSYCTCVDKYIGKIVHIRSHSLGYAVAHLVETLRYKSECRGLDFR